MLACYRYLLSSYQQAGPTLPVLAHRATRVQNRCTHGEDTAMCTCRPWQRVTRARLTSPAPPCRNTSQTPPSRVPLTRTGLGTSRTQQACQATFQRAILYSSTGYTRRSPLVEPLVSVSRLMHRGPFLWSGLCYPFFMHAPKAPPTTLALLRSS